MLKKIMFCALGLVALTTHAQVVPNIDWVQTYNPRNQMDNMPSTLDANNNVYVTGYYSNSANKNLVILKYDSLGTLLWAHDYDNGGDDIGTAVKVSSAGNVYVTGVSSSTTTSDDFITQKYSPSGTLLWSKRFDYSGGADGAVDIKIDEANAYVYVVGTGSNGTNNDIITIQYKDANGTIYWNNYFDGAANDQDDAVGLVVANGGADIIVCGNSKNGSGNMDILAFQLDNSGSLIWTTMTDGTANADDRAEAIILAGTKFGICGMINNSSTNDDYTTILFDEASGSSVWQMDYDVSNGYESATSLVLDSIGNIAVTGYVNNSSIYEYHTILYDSTGTQLWTNIENTGIAGLYIEPRIACDTIAHHFYVAGAKANTSNDAMVYQITPTGNTTWKKAYDGAGNGHDAATGMAVNGVGVVYMSALCTNTASGFDITTIKISQTPVYFPVNYNFIPDTFSFSNLYYPNTNEVLDTTGNIASEVLFYTKFTYPNQYVLKDRVSFCELKKDSTGTSISDTLSRVDMVFQGGNKLTGTYPLNYQTNSSLNYFMSHTGKVDIQGASHLMVPNIYPLIDLYYSSNSVGSKYYFVVKPGGVPEQIRLAFEGAASTTLTGNDLQINSSLGSWKFKKPEIYNVAMNFTTMALSTTTVSGSNGWSHVTGDIYSINTGTYSNSWPLIIEFDMGKLSSPPTSSLNCKWSTYVGGGNNDAPSEIKSNSANEIFVVGYTTSNNFPPGSGTSVFQNFNAGGNDGYIEKYDVNGVRLWATYVGGPFTDQVKSIDFINGDLYIVGQSSSALPTLGKAGATNSLTQLGGQDGFILQTSANSAVKKWLTYFGGSSADQPAKCKFDINGNFFIVGTTASTNIPVVGSSPQYTQTCGTASNTTDGFIIRYNSSSQVTWRTYVGSTNDASSAGNNTDGLRDLDFNSSNDLYVVGFASGSDYPNITNGSSTNYSYNGSGQPDCAITRFSNTGQIKWSSFVGGNGLDYFIALKIKNNKIHVTGQRDPLGANFPVKNSGNWFYSASSSGLSDAIFIVYNTNDSLLHSTFLQGNSNMLGLDIDADSTNRIYVSGLTRSSIFPTALTQPSGAYVETFKGSSDYFIYALEEGNSNVVWATDIGGTGDEGFFSGLGGGYIDIDNQNTLHIVGATTSSSVFPLFDGAGVPYYDPTQNGAVDASITRFYLQPVNGVNQIKEFAITSSGLSVYPNPAKSNLTIKLDGFKEKTYFYIYNTIGQMVNYGILETNYNKIDVSDLSEGLYLLEVKDNTHKSSAKFIKND